MWELELCFRVDAGFAVPFAAWNAAVAIANDTLVSTGRWGELDSVCLGF